MKLPPPGSRNSNESLASDLAASVSNTFYSPTDSAGIRRNPGIPTESAGIDWNSPESAGIDRNSPESTGICTNLEGLTIKAIYYVWESLI